MLSEKGHRFVTVLSLLVFLVLIILSVIMNLSISMKFVKISNYSTDISNWTLLLFSTVSGLLFIWNVSKHVDANSAILLAILFISIMTFMELYKGLSYVVDEHIAFSGYSTMTNRVFPIQGTRVESHRQTLLYRAVINNKGFIAEISITQRLYNFVGSNKKSVCFDLPVQKSGMNERGIFRGHNVLDETDTFIC